MQSHVLYCRNVLRRGQEVLGARRILRYHCADLQGRISKHFWKALRKHALAMLEAKQRAQPEHRQFFANGMKWLVFILPCLVSCGLFLLQRGAPMPVWGLPPWFYPHPNPHPDPHPSSHSWEAAPHLPPSLSYGCPMDGLEGRWGAAKGDCSRPQERSSQELLQDAPKWDISWAERLQSPHPQMGRSLDGDRRIKRSFLMLSPHGGAGWRDGGGEEQRCPPSVPSAVPLPLSAPQGTLF